MPGASASSSERPDGADVEAPRGADGLSATRPVASGDRVGLPGPSSGSRGDRGQKASATINTKAVPVTAPQAHAGAACQIRFMAVENGQQRKGYGTRLLTSLEEAARELNLDTIILQARENAVPFYERHGYRVEEKSFLLFDEIQHYLMKKRLDD